MVTWKGTTQESMDLTNALARNCDCKFGLMGVRLVTCPAHEMLTNDQRALDGLLWFRHFASDLLEQEGIDKP